MNKDKIKTAKKTLLLLKKKSWNSISLKEVIKNSKKSNLEYKDKNDLLKNINRYFDYLLKNNLTSLENSSTKDMLFEIIMARFDILESNRKSVLKIYEYLKKNPKNAVLLIPSFLESMILIASSANMNIKGIRGSINIKGVFVIYFLSSLVWTTDEKSSLEKTMTAIDKYLNQADKINNFF